MSTGAHEQRSQRGGSRAVVIRCVNGHKDEDRLSAMLLECKNCGAPLDVESGDRLTRCKYCGAVSRAKKLKTVAVVTPPQWQPPAQWVPPPQARADSSRTLVYNASLAIGRLIRTIVTLSFLLIVLTIALPLAIQWIARLATQKEIEARIDEAKAALEAAGNQVRAANQSEQKPVHPDLITAEGAAEVANKTHELFRGERIRLLELLLYQTQAVMKAQDPKNPKHVDQYTYRDGKFDSPMPVNVQYLHGKLEPHLFDFDEIGLDRFGSIAQTALDKLDLEKGKVTHVMVDKGDGKLITVRVYAAGPRESGFVELDANGKIRRVSK